MSTPKSQSRRNFLKSTVTLVGASAVAGTAPALWTTAAAAQTLRIGFISPLTGALAGFGECNPHLIKLAQDALKAGIRLGDQTYAIEILMKDTQSDPNRAAELARQLITSDKVDLMLSCSAPETVNPVADACEAAGVPSVSTTVPWEAFYFGRGAKPGAPSPFKWTYHFAFGTAQFAQCYISKWNGAVKTNGKVGVLYPNDADGNAVRANLLPALVKAGFIVIDPGAYEDGTTDYSAQIARFKQENVEIINTFPLPPDFAVFWRQAAQQGLTKKIKIIETGKTGLFASQIQAMGALGLNMTAGAPWHPAFPYSSPLTGLSSKQLADGYESASGRQWTLQIGQTMALIDVGVAALKAAGNPASKEEVAKAISKLRLTTTMGELDWTKGPVPNCVSTPIIGIQWSKPKQSKFSVDAHVVDNACDRNVPIGAPLVSYSS
ncbi:ABC transporter substrate-binding protein [Bradyrhizobium liaoningense]|uniref:ABC transporter substrate-binding protein n=1 Tax=Bradyrhizobium liaoningense TaxID=43992 RepID=UPI001BA5B704|nr:ABC transporter substrate-binding protein [Bradyrhizobium liaoningense]MBR0706250.1 ABC transporter substrate-binding protein [Bradyrhizobium liaoningense]